jgi:predicted RNA-binding Zn-ribbon protein involved in translation (DUF1610 family)
MRRWSRAGAWLAAAMALISGALLGLGLAPPARHVGLGRFSIELCHGRLDIARGTVPLRWVAPDVWGLGVPGSNPVLALGPRSRWLPSSERATVSVGSTAVSTSYFLDALFVPLWPWVLLFAGAGAALWSLSRVHPVGHCTACGYDLQGLARGNCPECGNAAPPRSARIRTILRQYRGRAPRIP